MERNRETFLAPVLARKSNLLASHLLSDVDVFFGFKLLSSAGDLLLPKGLGRTPRLVLGDWLL